MHSKMHQIAPFKQFLNAIKLPSKRHESSPLKKVVKLLDKYLYHCCIMAYI